MNMVFESFPLENGEGLEKSKAEKTSTEWPFSVSLYGPTLCLPYLHLPAVLLDVCSPALPSLRGDGF